MSLTSSREISSLLTKVGPYLIINLLVQSLNLTIRQKKVGEIRIKKHILCHVQII